MSRYLDLVAHPTTTAVRFRNNAYGLQLEDEAALERIAETFSRPARGGGLLGSRSEYHIDRALPLATMEQSQAAEAINTASDATSVDDKKRKKVPGEVLSTRSSAKHTTTSSPRASSLAMWR